MRGNEGNEKSDLECLGVSFHDNPKLLTTIVSNRTESIHHQVSSQYWMKRSFEIYSYGIREFSTFSTNGHFQPRRHWCTKYLMVYTKDKHKHKHKHKHEHVHEHNHKLKRRKEQHLVNDTWKKRGLSYQVNCCSSTKADQKVLGISFVVFYNRCFQKFYYMEWYRHAASTTMQSFDWATHWWEVARHSLSYGKEAFLMTVCLKDLKSE
jgi:hypothetical protein